MSEEIFVAYSLLVLIFTAKVRGTLQKPDTKAFQKLVKLNRKSEVKATVKPSAVKGKPILYYILCRMSEVQGFNSNM